MRWQSSESMCSSHSAGARGGQTNEFTFVELLVVISMITALVGTITVHIAREQANRAACLHLLGSALASYATDQAGWFPASRTPMTANQDDARVRCACFPSDGGGFLEHKTGNNILFADLHVEAFQKFDSNLMTFHPSKMMAWADVVPPKK